MEKSKQEEQKTVRRYYEPKTSPLVDINEWTVDEEGHHILKKVGEKNLDDEIQLYKDSCDIKIIVERMMNGDVNTIKQLASPGLYGDVNDYPEGVHPAAYAQSLKTLYDNQSAAFKEKFPTYELFEKFYANLTEAAIAQMFAPKQEEKQEVKADGE